MQHDVLQMDGYEALESIGSGSFGLIRKVRRKADGKILARKEIDYRKMSTKEKEQLVAEVNILKDLKHPNIVEFLERVIDREHSFIYILMEYCEGGDLAAVIKRHKERSIPIPEEFVWGIMTQLVLALHECHCGIAKNGDSNELTPRPILHRDLKPDNVFLDAKKNVKLGDFGLSRSLTNPQMAFAQTYVGTPFYMSPELISESVYDVKSDIWSLGCVVFEMCALEPPFLADTQAALSLKIKMGRIQMLPAQYSQELNMVVRAMLQVNPKRRPTTTDLLANPRIKNISVQLELKRKSAELDHIMRSLIEREEKIKEKEVYLMNAEKNFQTADQMLREKETVLNSREEILRNRESSLTEREMKLTWERQQLDERRRELLLEQEKRQSMARKVMSSKLSEPMAIDSGSLHDTTTVTTTATASKTNSLSTNTTASHAMHSTTASTASTSQANVSNTMERFFAALAADQGQNTRTFPRRKTGLSAGRHSLQAASVYRTSGSNGSITNVFSAQQTSSSEALDLGGTYASGQLASNSGNAPKTASTENPSTASKLLQGQSYTYQGANGKETRLSGRLGQLPSLSSGGSAATSLSTADSQRLRGKSKSASALVASMSSTSLSSKTPAPSSSINPFVVPEFMKPSAATTSAGGLTGVSSNHNSIPGLTFTASTTLLTTSPTTNLDMQMSDTTDSSSQPSSVSVNTGNSLRPTSTPNSSSSRSLYPPFSSSSVTTSRLSSIRPHLIPSIGHSRFNSALASSSAGSNSHSTLSTASASIPSLNSNDTQSLAAASATNGNAVAQDTSTTPSKSQSATNFGDERFQRHSTPERSQRLEDEDLRMEWDDDIPSPFIKKTYQRPPPAGSGGPLPYRNLMGS